VSGSDVFDPPRECSDGGKPPGDEENVCFSGISVVRVPWVIFSDV